MSIPPDEFDRLVVDLLDACRQGDINAVLDLYDEGAVMECGCEGVILTGRDSIAAHWAPKLEGKRFDPHRVALTSHGVQIDFQSCEGKLVRFYFRFGSSNKIIYTSCGPLVGAASARRGPAASAFDA